MEIVNSGGTALHVLSEGPADGPAVMLCNSLGTDLRVWDAMVKRLPRGLRIVRYDKRGHGLSDCPPGPYAIGDLVDDAAAVADALGLRGVAFVGLSIGGLIGLGLAESRPDLLKSLVLMDTAARIGTPEMWQERVGALRHGGMEAIADSILERWFAVPKRDAPVPLAPWRNMLLRTPLEGYAGCCAAIAGADFTDAARNLGIPVMAMAGSLDGATPPELVQATAQLCGAPFHLLEGAGHLPCVELPDETAGLIAAFVEEA